MQTRIKKKSYCILWYSVSWKKHKLMVYKMFLHIFYLNLPTALEDITVSTGDENKDEILGGLLNTASTHHSPHPPPWLTSSHRVQPQSGMVGARHPLIPGIVVFPVFFAT